MPRNSLTSISAFSGLGGLDLGLSCAGFRSVLSIERDHAARRSLASNGLHSELSPIGDICELARSIRPRDVGLRQRELDLLAGGPPCQPFSKAAQWSHRGRSGLEDPRSDCLWAFLDLLDKFLPRALIIENVPGFVRGTTNAVPVIEQFLSEVNTRRKTRYALQSRVIDAADFGVPQKRSRAILVAFRDGSTFDWPEARFASHPVTAWDALWDVQLDEVPQPSGRWADLLPSIPEGHNYLWHTPVGGGQPLFSYRSRYWSFLLKLSKAAPSWTISASPGPSTGPFHWDNRPLAPQEMLRLQSFPVDWQISGDHRTQVRQVGNATPPLLAEYFGRAIRKMLTGRSLRSDLALAIRRRVDTPPAARPRRVQGKYLQLRGDHPAHPGTGKGPGAMMRTVLVGTNT